MIKQIIEARIEQNITHEELAQRIGIRQGKMSQLEDCGYNPSLNL